MFFISLWLSKLYYFLTKRKATTDKSGILARKIDIDFIEHVKKPPIVIAVTGTNGKTTTCNFLVDILEKSGYKVTSNREGANYPAGVSKALMKGVSIFNKSKVDVAVIEFDELSSKEILPFLHPTYTVVTNLFLDTMKRNAHTDYVFSKIEEGLPEDTTLFLNADDLISSQLGKNNKKIYFGIDRLPTDSKTNQSLVQDIRVCPKCYTPLEFEYFHYHHLGKAKCPNCGYTNPEPKYRLTDIDYENNQITINGEKYMLVNEGLFNIYNELLAISVLSEIGVKDINKCLETLEVVKTRYNKTTVKNIEIISQMAKGQNPIAVSRALDYVKNLKGTKEVIIILDDVYDNKAANHSEVVSWLYDSDFEALNGDDVKKVVVCGFRAYDYKVRALLAGIDKSKIFVSTVEAEAYKYLDLSGEDKIVIVHDIYLNNKANEIIAKIKEVTK